MTSTPRTNESDELEKIMNEIEQLQSEISDVEGTPAASPSGNVGEVILSNSLTAEEEDILKEIQASATSIDPALPADMQGNMEETLAQLGEVEAASSILEQMDEQVEAKHKEDAPMSNPIHGNCNNNDSKDGSLTLTLTGNMTLKLKYEFEGQEVIVSFADQALRVQMTDGTEFKVPVSRLQAAAGTTTGNVKPIRKTG